MKTKTDEEIIAAHDPGARARVRIELQIVDAIIEQAVRDGYTLRCLGYEDDEVYDLKTELLELDDAHITVHFPDGKRLGWMRLVFGNEGYDLVSDYSLSLGGFLAPIIDLSEKLG